jgi:hypothetical protein
MGRGQVARETVCSLASFEAMRRSTRIVRAAGEKNARTTGERNPL